MRFLPRARRVSFVPQMQAADCGAACLAAVARFHGLSISMRRARELCNVGRDGARASEIVRAARQCGFDSDGIRIKLDDVDASLLPAIAHVRAEHYVVLERVGRHRVVVVDPALGRRRLPIEEFGGDFSGVLLRVRPGAGFVPSSDRLPLLPRVLGLYRRVLRSVRAKVVLASLATAALLVAALLTPVVVANAAADRGLGLGTVLRIAVASAVAFALLAAARGRLLLSVKLAHDRRVASDLVDHLVGLDLAYFHSRSTGDLLSRVTSTTSIRDALSTAAVTSAVDALAAVVYLALLAAFDPAVALAALAAAAILLGTPVVAYRLTRTHALTQLERRAASNAKLITLLVGIEQAKAHAAERALADDWRDVYGEELAALRRSGRIDSLAQAITSTCRLVAPAALVLVAQASAGSPVRAIGFGLSAAAFLGPIGNLAATLTSLIATYAHLMRLEDILEESSTPPDTEPRGGDPVTIELSDVCYAYPGTTRRSVQGVSLTIPAGQTVVLTGGSGCGKSTLARLVAGLLEPAFGEVRFVGAGGVVARPAIGYVAQTVALYPGTIATNITFGRDAPDDAVRAAVEAADLAEFVGSLRLGLGTPVLDSGYAFSGGQRQRIAIARALLGNPPVVVFDEATSNLDAATEERVLAALARMPATKILIAHGPQALRYADVVLDMENGRIVGQRPAPAADGHAMQDASRPASDARLG